MVLVTAASVLHLLFGALWTGSVVFLTYAVLPEARDATLGPEPLDAVVGKFLLVSRTSALVLLLTGAYLASANYTGAELTGTGRGHLVLTMIVLWLALGALVEVSASRLRDGFDREKVREPEREARRLLQGATVVSLLLLVDAGVLVGGLPT